MAILTEHFVFCHLPKCGGQFIRYVLDQLNIPNREIGEYHDTFMKIKPFLNGKVLSITNIRHPLTWYQSRWYHRVRIGWIPNAKEDWFAASNDFNEFVKRMQLFDPNGRLSTIIKQYDDGFNGSADYILRQEFLSNDLYNLLKGLYDFNDKTYWSLKPQNISGNDESSSSSVAIYDQDVLDDMISREHYILDKYYSGVTDPKNLADLLVL